MSKTNSKLCFVLFVPVLPDNNMALLAAMCSNSTNFNVYCGLGVQHDILVYVVYWSYTNRITEFFLPLKVHFN